VESEWCRRFDPDERWLRQLESELDRLIALADDMRKACDHQIELSQSMAQKAANVQQEVGVTRKQMQQMMDPPSQ
jgi:hypothetical protein